MIPAADALAGRSWPRLLGWGVLAASVWSAASAAQNPWRHPWLFEYWMSLGWIAY
jgi:hypothetical protein